MSALVGCSGGPVAPEGAPAPSGEVSGVQGSTTGSADGTALRQAVRVDPVSLESTTLGTLRLGGRPRHEVEVVEGGEELRGMVAAINALAQLTVTRSDGTEVRIERGDDRFLPVLEQHWLKAQRGVHLRVAPVGGRAARRVDAWAVRDGKSERLGTLEIDGMDYLNVVGGPLEQRARLGGAIGHHNERPGIPVQIPPPDGQEGKYARVIERGTPEHFGLMRDEVLKTGLVLAREGNGHFDSFVVAGSPPRGDYRWLKVHVGGGLVVVPPVGPVVVHLAGPPGEPLAFRALSYSDVAYDEAGLRAYARGLHGDAQAYTEGATSEVEIAGRRRLALAFRTGADNAAADHVLALWPAIRHLDVGDVITPDGVAIELTTAANGAEPSAPAVLADPTLSRVLDSLLIDL